MLDTANQSSTPEPATSQVEQSNSPIVKPDMRSTVENARLRQHLQQIIAQNETHDITSSVSVTSIGDARSLFRYNTSQPQFAASVNKMPIALLLLEDLRKGSISLDTTLTWTADDVRGGFGAYDQPGAAMSATVRQVMYDMLNTSGNTAVRALVNYGLGGPVATNQRLAAKPQLITTRLQVLDPVAKTFYLGNSTSDESLWVMEQLLAEEDAYQSFIRQALATNIFSYYGVRSQLESNDFIVLANKVGILDDADGNNRHDVGVIYNTRNGKVYGYSFMTTTSSGNVSGTAQAEHSLDLLGRHVLRFAGDKPAKTPKYNTQQNSRSFSPETRVAY